MAKSTKIVTFATVAKVYKQVLASAYKEFVKNPSAYNYVELQNAMLAYQNFIKNS